MVAGGESILIFLLGPPHGTRRGCSDFDGYLRAGSPRDAREALGCGRERGFRRRVTRSLRGCDRGSGDRKQFDAFSEVYVN